MTSLFDYLYDKVNTIKSYNKDFKDYQNAFDNFTNVNPMPAGKGNALRHIGASMYFSSNYGVDNASRLGTSYEYLPQITSASEPGDTKIDLYNNYIGRTEGKKYNKLTPQEALTLSAQLINNTDKAAIKSNDIRAIKMQYPTTLWQKLIGTIKN